MEIRMDLRNSNERYYIGSLRKVVNRIVNTVLVKFLNFTLRTTVFFEVTAVGFTGS